MTCPFVHLELNTEDADTAKAFYSKLFGWRYHDTPVEGSFYTAVKMTKSPGAAVVTKPADGSPAAWMPYVAVPDVEAVVDVALDEGAELVHPVTEVPGFGWYAIIIDPTGAMLGLWETFDPGRARVRDHGRPKPPTAAAPTSEPVSEPRQSERGASERPRPVKATRSPTSRRRIPSRRQRGGAADEPEVSVPAELKLKKGERPRTGGRFVKREAAESKSAKSEKGERPRKGGRFVKRDAEESKSAKSEKDERPRKGGRFVKREAAESKSAKSDKGERPRKGGRFVKQGSSANASRKQPAAKKSASKKPSTSKKKPTKKT